MTAVAAVAVPGDGDAEARGKHFFDTRRAAAEAALTKSTFELRSGELLASVEGAKLRGSRAANGGALVLLRFTTNSGRVGGVLPAPAVV